MGNYPGDDLKRSLNQHHLRHIACNPYIHHKLVEEYYYTLSFSYRCVCAQGWGTAIV